MTSREKLLTVREPDAPITEAEEEAAAGLVLALQEKAPVISVTEDPEVDPEILGVFYRLRPERAPKPRVTINDILASVKEGPLAVPEVQTGKATGSSRPIRDSGGTPVARPASGQKARPRWLVPVLGLGATAALAMALIVPMAGQVADQAAPAAKEAFEPTSAIPEVVAPTPRVAPSVAADPNAPMPELASAAPVREEEARGSGEVEEKPAEASSKSPSTADKSTTDKSTTDKTSPKAERAQQATGVERQNEPKGAVAQAEMAPAVDDAERAMLEALGYIEEDAPPPPTLAANNAQNTPADTTTASGAGASGSSGPVATSASKPRAEKAKSSTREDKKETQVVAEAELSDQDDAMAGDEARSAYKPAPSAPPVAELVIWPMDYSSKWYQSYPDVASVYAAAQVLESEKKWTEAAMLYRDLMKDGRSFVAQDAAYYCARAWWSGGSSSSALSVIEEGLKKSSVNTPYRARLFALKGDILSTQGKTSEAEAAWNEASNLNAAR